MTNKEKEKLISFAVSSGKSLLSKQGEIKDIGIKKKWLTKEDIRIERGLKNIVNSFEGENKFFSEEENDKYISGGSTWVADPISGTKRFIEGAGNYTIAIAHLQNGSVDFGLIYNPTADKLYQSDKSGVYLNGKLIVPLQNKKGKRIIYAPSYGWKDLYIRDELRTKLAGNYELCPKQGSFAWHYCLVASREFDGLVSLTKDSFPEFAGCYIANQAGLIATNINGDKNISPRNRIFVCGTNHIHSDLLELTKSVLR